MIMSTHGLRSWVRLIFHSYNRAIIGVLYPPLIFIVLYAIALSYVVEIVGEDTRRLMTPYLEGTDSYLSLMGVILGIFLVFRCNTAYDRWWEGRKLWGEMVNNTRYLAMKIAAYLPKKSVEKDWVFFSLMIPNFAYATKEHLRKGTKMTELTFETAAQKEHITQCEHKPNGINLLMCKRLNKLYEGKYLTGDHLIILDKELKKFMDILGACERIKHTPIPFSFSMYVKKFIFIYSLIFPFAFVLNFNYLSAFLTGFLFYVLAGIDIISAEIEDPFGLDSNDLPLDGLCGSIKRNVQEILQQDSE